MSSDPPAYEPPGPEITGESRAVDNGGDTFKDEPSPGENSDEGDPVKWNFSPTTIIILVILNLIALGAVGYLIWYAVDQATNTPAPTPAPTLATPAPSMAPSASMRPSMVPSKSLVPSSKPSGAPSIDSTPAPTSSSQPTPIASSSPTAGPYSCSLCGEGNTMATDNLSASVTFGSRVTRTCQELLTDQDNGDILEEQCIALYDQIVATCGCSATIGARADSDITALITAAGIDVTATDEASALAAMLNSATDTYFASSKATMTDVEVVERYIMILALTQLKATTTLSTLYASDVCSWTSVAACEFGQVTSVHLDANTEAVVSGTPTFPVDLFRLADASTIWVNNYPFASTIPTTIPQSDLLTSLQLIGNSLTGTLPDALFEFRSLTSLDLSNNGLSGNLSDKSKIKQLIRLDSLDLGINTFTGTLATCDLTTKPTTIITDCASEVTCSCCTSCADTTTGTV